MLVADKQKFPKGIKAISDSLHQRGLLFGIYTDRGTKTCGGRPASEGYEAQDSKTFASWGVDYIKSDSCNVDRRNFTLEGYQFGLMRDALNKTGRRVYFSLCSVYIESASIGNSWRIANDINSWPNTLNAINCNAGLHDRARPGAWNDVSFLL